MTRRPRKNRPPRLDAPPAPAAAPNAKTGPKPPTPRRALLEAHAAGPHARLSRSELEAIVNRVVGGSPEARLGLELGPITRAEARRALAEEWGEAGEGGGATIDPDRTLAGAAAAEARLRAVVADGGRIAFATGRPASLLAPCGAISSAARAGGASILASSACGPMSSGRSLWWIDDVAVVTDGQALLASDDVDAADEWLFTIGRPALAVADRAFAGAAIAAGIETIAFADLDALVLGVAVQRGCPVQLVPLDTGRPPEAYAAVVEALLTGAEPGPEAPEPHSTTPTPPAYAAPESGGEG